MEKEEKSSLLSPLSFNLTTNRLSKASMDKRQRRKSVCSPMSNSSSLILGFDSFSINDRRNVRSDTTMYRPLTENSVLPRPQWYEELVQRRMTEEPLHFDSRHKQPSVQKSNHPSIDVSEPVPQPSPDIMMLLDSNYTPQRIAKSGRRASVCLESPDVFSFNQPFLIPKETVPIAFSTNSAKISESVSPRKMSVSLRKERSTTIEETNDMFLVDSIDGMQTSDFIIPELPEGQEMVIELKSNWGDEDFIGLNGIEIFEMKTTNIAKIDKIFCESNPNCDVSALFDGVQRTHDNSHIWLTSFNQSKPIKIRVKFSDRITLLLIRIWNYNKSRIYSDRGVKLVEITLDTNLVFRGEIAKAFGELCGPPERFGDTILFTTNEELLESLGKHDKSFKELLSESSYQ